MNRNKKVLISLAVVAVGLGAILCFMVGQRSNGSQSVAVASRSVQTSQSARPRQSAVSHPQSSSSQPATDQFSDEDYQLIAYLKLVDEDGSGAASEQLASLDKLHGGPDEITMWNDLGDGHSIGFGAHTTAMRVKGDQVEVTFDEETSSGMGHGNGHRTYSKAELAQEFAGQTDQVKQAVANLQQYASHDN